MKPHRFQLLLLILPLFAAATNTAFAQDEDSYHPFLTDQFNIGLGGFWPKKGFEIQVDGTTPGDLIDFDETARFNDSEATGSLTFRWNFGEKWSFWTQAWQVDSRGETRLDEDVDWGDLTFKEGTFARAGTDLSVVRLFFGRRFWTKPGHEFGAGIGAHWMELGAFLEGEIIVNDNSTGFQRGAVDANIPLPNIGAWYNYSWSRRWMLRTRLDWLQVSIGDYSGGLWNAAAGIHYQPFKHIGFGLEYNNFILDVDVDKNDWHGGVELRQNGPRFSVTASW